MLPHSLLWPQMIYYRQLQMKNYISKYKQSLIIILHIIQMRVRFYNFLNYRITQSSCGTSVDQFNHIRQTMLQVFFPENTTVPFQSSPFPLDTSIEMELFQTTPMLDSDIQIMTEKCNGSYNHWVGALLHIADKSRWDLSYLAIQLSGYNNFPSVISYNILYQGM